MSDFRWRLNYLWAVFLIQFLIMQSRKVILVIGLISIALGMAYIFATTAEVSSNPTFAEARQSGKTQKVIGELSSNHKVLDTITEEGELVKFHLTDDNKETVQVEYWGSKPYQFENSEQITVTGYFDSRDLFVAEEILIKCPSKYEGTDGV